MDPLTCAVSDGVATLTIRRPAVSNAIDITIVRAMHLRIGAGRSLSALMLSEAIGAKTALEWGLVYAITPPHDVVARAQTVARRLATGPSAALWQIRSPHASTFDNSLMQQLRAERAAQEMTLESHECVEGVRAFFEKREPKFVRN